MLETRSLGKRQSLSVGLEDLVGEFRVLQTGLAELQLGDQVSMSDVSQARRKPQPRTTHHLFV
jgi:hypothetical protein